MGLDLFNTTVLSTYDSLIKVGDNDTLTGTPKLLSDGRGNDTPIWLSTNSLGIGVTPESGYTFQVSGLTKLSTVTITSNVTANSFIKSGGLSSQFLKADGSVDSNTYQSVHQKGLANGYAPLDGGAKISEAYLPDSIVGQLEYQGTWNATTNTPTLPSASTVKGHYYVTSVAGTYQTIEYAIGDWIISNGTSWEKVDNTDAVTTVFGRIGPILADGNDYSEFYHPKNGDLAANASTATTLQTARFINGTSFNGSANITTAIWGSSRTITIGDTAKSLNGSTNVAWSRAELGITKTNIDALNIDADTLDGQQGSYYAAASSLSNYLPLTGGTLTGNLGIGVSPLTAGGAAKWIALNGTSTYGGGLISSINGVAKGYVYSEGGSMLLQAVAGEGIKLLANGSNSLVIDSSHNAIFTGTVGASNLSGTNTGDQDLSGYLLNTSDTMSGTLNITGSLAIGKTTAPATTLDINGGILANGNIATSSGQMAASGGNSTQWTSAYSFTNGFSIGNYYTPLDDRYLRRFQGTATGVSNAGFTTAFTVNGGNLASSIRFSVQGTTGSVVVSNLVDLIVNHYQDIMIKSLSGIYTKLTLKVVSNNNEDFAVELKTNHANPVNLYIEVLCYGAETVTFTNTHSYTGATLEKELPAGEFISGTGGNQGNSVIDGNVGIGTSNPVSPIDVVSAANATGVTLRGRSADNIGTFNFSDNAGNVSSQIQDRNGQFHITTLDTSPILFNTAASERMRIDSSGNVGIGTTSPYDSKLQVVGRIRAAGGTNGGYFFGSEEFDGGFYAPSDGNLAFSTNNTERIRIDSSGDVGIGLTETNSVKLGVTGNSGLPATSGTTQTGLLRLKASNNATLDMGADHINAVGWLQVTDVADLSYEYNLLLQPNGGSVGIGKNSPSQKLDVNGNVNIDGTLYSNRASLIRNETSSVPLQLVSNQVGNGSGSVGIEFGYDIYGYRKGAILFQSSDGAARGSLIFATNNSTSGANATIADERMRIDSSGNVKINGSGRLQMRDDGSYIYEDNGLNIGNGGTGTGRSINFLTENTERMRIDSSGNVKIGGIRLNPSGNGGDLLFGSNTATYAGIKTDSPAAQDVDLTFHTTTNAGVDGAPERMRINSSGNVGIGTTSPSDKLEVNGDIKLSSTAALTSTPSYIWLGNDYSNGTTRDKLKIYLYNSGTEQYGFTVGYQSDIQYHSNQKHDFYVANSPKLRIDQNGNVGINTTTPVGKLNVALPADSDGNVGAWSSNQVVFTRGGTNTSQGLGFSVHDSANSATISSLTPAITWSDLVYRALNHSFYSNGSALAMYLNSSGNVGIGTASPSAKLDVDGSIRLSTSGTVEGRSYPYTTNIGSGANATSTNIRAGSTDRSEISLIGGDVGDRIEFKTNSTERMRIDSSGRVGIGRTPASDMILDIAKSNTPIFRITDTQSGGKFFLLGVDTNNNFLRTDGNMLFQVGGSTTRMVIDSAGNVGIGTTAPSAKLEISSSATTPALILTSDGGNEQFKIRRHSNNNEQLIIGFHSSDYAQIQAVEQNVGYRTLSLNPNGGNVGIGVTSPSATLHINGTGYYSNQLTVDGFGNNAGISFRNGFNPTNVGIRAKAITSGNRDGLEILGYNGIDFTINNGNTIAMHINGQGNTGNEGNVGIGTTSPSQKLQVAGTAQVDNLLVNFGAGNNKIGFTSSGNHTDGFPYARIQESWGVSFQPQDARWAPSVIGSSFLVGFISSGASYGVGNIFASGDVTAYASDKRLKKNIKTIDNALEKVLKLNGVTYNWDLDLCHKWDFYPYEGTEAGVLAQEVQEVLPEVVKRAPFDYSADENGNKISKSGENYLTVDYEKMVPLLIEAIKEQQKQIDELKNRLDGVTN